MTPAVKDSSTDIGPKVILVIGEDDYLVGEAAKKVVGDGVGLELIDSNTSTNAELQLRDLRAVEESFMTPPFFDPKKVTWWKNVHFLPHQGNKPKPPSEEVKEALEKFATKVASSVLPENQKFLITAPVLRMDSIFAKTMKGVAEVIEYKSGKSWERRRNAIAWVNDLAAEMNLKFAPGASDQFVDIVGFDSRSLLSELGKMRDYLGAKNHTIDETAVKEIASPGVKSDPEIWAVTDAIGARDLEKGLIELRRFERENGFAVFVSAQLEKLFRQLAELKDAAARGCLDSATEGMAPFVARKLQGFLPKWTLQELRLARRRFLLLRERAVSGLASADTLVITELVRTCGMRRRHA